MSRIDLETPVAVGIVDVAPAVRILLTVGLLIYLPGSWIGVRYQWRDRVRVLDSAPVAWPYGEALWRGYVRAIPAGVAAFWAGGLFVLWGLYGSLDPHALTLAIAAVTLGSAAVGFLVAASAAYLNRPRFAVPPHLRDQPGVLAEWRDSRRARRATRSARQRVPPRP